MYALPVWEGISLCRASHPQFDHIGHSCDELPIGRLASAGRDGISEILVQYIQVASAPGPFDEMADGPLKIPFIRIFMA